MDDIDAYKEILAVLNKHKGLVETDYQIDITWRLENRIRLQELSKEFGIELNKESDPDWCKISEFEYIGQFGPKTKRSISWSDDGKQPEDEMLYMISFPSGAYIFGQEYPAETFKAFFDELKSYGSKYSDTHNHNLYFSSAVACEVHRNFKGIFAKYKGLVDEELKKNRVKALEEELAKLKETK